MTASEIVMKRDDPNIAWGFRLTGGFDLGTPFYVVKVLGRGHAERAGLRIGDMVYAINHNYINNFTHKDAQNAILHSGDTLILNIKRGPSSGRGTPLPEYTDPVMGLAVPPETPRPKPVPLPPYQPPPPIVKEPTPPESEDEEAEETVVAFNVKINPRGRIAAIEELPVTPPPSRSSSRAKTRSRSASRDRRRSASSKQDSIVFQQPRVQNGVDGNQNGLGGVQNGRGGGIYGPEETFTYSKEVVTQYSTVLSAADQANGNISESINESFVIHGGSQHKMEDILSPEDIERDIFEEKMEEQKITELLTGEAEVLDQGIVGINFQKIIPKTNFIKDSNVFKELQDQCIKKEEPEEVQLQKDPTKRFSTFLQTPKRPIPKPKPKTPQPAEDLPWKKRLASPQPEIQPQLQNVQDPFEHEPSTETLEPATTYVENVSVVEEVCYKEETREETIYQENTLAVNEPVITEAVSTENMFEEKVRFNDTTDEKQGSGCTIEEIGEKTATSEGQRSETQSVQSEKLESSSKVEYKNEFERQLAEIQKQLESIQQLPSVLQSNLTALQEQLTNIIKAKSSADEKEKIEAEKSSLKRDSLHSQLNWKIDVTVQEEKTEVNEEELHAETEEENQIENTETSEQQEIQMEETKVNETELDYEGVEHTEIEQFKNMKNKQFHSKDSEPSSVRKPSMLRNFPRNVAERPIVLPGGRKWYKPRDAYNEDFIAETIIHQSEVLVGTTIGLNFLKYEPPKFDANNSAVYRLIHEIEEKGNNFSATPIEARPEKVLAEEDYCPPISKRHFFAARLAEQGNESVEKILQEANNQTQIAV